MKKIIALAGVVVVCWLITGCSTPAYVEKDTGFNASSYKTYAWVNTRSGENDESARATARADISMHNAVNAQLNGWGWREVSEDENPDVLISYDVIVERSLQTQSTPVYSQSFVRYYYNPGRRRWGTIYYPSQFMGYQTYETPVKEGTIAITMVDAQSDKKIWQGWTTERLAGSGIDGLDVQKSVRNIFKQA